MHAISNLSFLTYFVWFVTSSFMDSFIKRGHRNKIPKFAFHIHHELKPFIPYLIAAFTIADAFIGKNIISNMINSGFSYYFWHIYKDMDDDDDRWKRRAEKALGSVRSLGHKLVVVNEGA